MTSIQLQPKDPKAADRLQALVVEYEAGTVSFSQLCDVAIEGYGRRPAAAALTLALARVQKWQTGDLDLRDAEANEDRETEFRGEKRTIVEGFNLALSRVISRRLGLATSDLKKMVSC